ncbi:hypothetical protein AK830_g4780 [Neonectria ditissima]|uniref:Uncharacterized protein n=1 Tax=Neonectria ditissima TaxID=78410 RepID=A0A0P7B7H0_9HYPO|nr:hypothetical protein AK830_g4780 [Neonectria ditissima]
MPSPSPALSSSARPPAAVNLCSLLGGLPSIRNEAGSGLARCAPGSEAPWGPGICPAIGRSTPAHLHDPCGSCCSNGPILIPRRDGNQMDHPCSRQALQSVGPAAPTAPARANVSSHVSLTVHPTDSCVHKQPQPYRHAHRSLPLPGRRQKPIPQSRLVVHAPLRRYLASRGAAPQNAAYRPTPDRRLSPLAPRLLCSAAVAAAPPACSPATLASSPAHSLSCSSPAQPDSCSSNPRDLDGVVAPSPDRPAAAGSRTSLVLRGPRSYRPMYLSTETFTDGDQIRNHGQPLAARSDQPRGRPAGQSAA